MKKICISIAVILITLTATAQKGLYIGYENGLKFDFYNYIDNQANTLKMLPLDGVWGGYLGYKMGDYTIETGFYGYYASASDLKFDSVTGKPEKTGGSMGSSGMNKWVIPVRFGKEFTFCTGRLYLKPEVGFITMIARDYGPDNSMGTSGYGIEFWPGSPWYTPGRDSLRMQHYSTGKYNFGMETSLCAGVRIKKCFDIYVKGTYTAAFNNLMYSTITYTSPYKTVTATSSTQNSMIYQIGLRYYFRK